MKKYQNRMNMMAVTHEEVALYAAPVFCGLAARLIVA